MNNFGTLYHYEVKKIISRKLVWEVFLICVLCIGVVAASDLTGKYYVDGTVVDTHYHMFQVDSAYQRALSGRKVNQELLEEMSAAYRKIPASAERYTLTEEYQTYARPYSDIFNLVRLWTQQRNAEAREWKPDEEALYAARAEALEEEWRTLRLSDTEKAFWREKEAQMDIPVTYQYHEAYSKIISHGLNLLGVLVPLSVAVCLASVFTEEHARRTDQLVLSGAKGKTVVYWAKIAAGTSVSGVCTIVLSSLVCGLMCIIYGTEGFCASLRISAYMWDSSCPLTIGEACLAAYAVLVITAVFIGVLVLVLSEALRNNIAALSVSVGLIITGMLVRLPYQYRILSQLWDWSPVRFLDAGNIFDIRLVTVFGHCLSAWQIVPAVYIFLGILAALAGRTVYQNYQVSGR